MIMNTLNEYLKPADHHPATIRKIWELFGN